MVEEIKEDWTYILINGKSKSIEVKNAEFDKGRLVKISEIKNYKKEDSEGKPIEHTGKLANDLKRTYYNKFFQKPFKNLMFLTGAGSSMDVGGLSMWDLWEETKKMYLVDKTDEAEEIDGFKLIREKVNYTEEDNNLEALLSQIEFI